MAVYSGYSWRPGWHGFSLLEVLTVLSLITVLAGFAIPQWQGHRYKVNTRLAWLHLEQIALAQSKYYVTRQAYADELAALTVRLSGNTGYIYTLDADDSSYTITAELPRDVSLGNPCWRLQLLHHGQRLAFDDSQQSASQCLYD